MNIQRSVVETCYTLPNRDVTAEPSTVIQFWNRKHKIGIPRQAKQLKGTGMFLNEHLTQKNAEIAR